MSWLRLRYTKYFSQIGGWLPLVDFLIGSAIWVLLVLLMTCYDGITGLVVEPTWPLVWVFSAGICCNSELVVLPDSTFVCIGGVIVVWFVRSSSWSTFGRLFTNTGLSIGFFVNGNLSSLKMTSLFTKKLLLLRSYKMYPFFHYLRVAHGLLVQML